MIAETSLNYIGIRSTFNNHMYIESQIRKNICSKKILLHILYIFTFNFLNVNVITENSILPTSDSNKFLEIVIFPKSFIVEEKKEQRLKPPWVNSFCY